MIIKNLSSKGFRNFSELEFSPVQNMNVIYGDNAQGKTNLLEAIWLFCGAKSFRGAKDSELLGFGQKRAIQLIKANCPDGRHCSFTFPPRQFAKSVSCVNDLHNYYTIIPATLSTVSLYKIYQFVTVYELFSNKLHR